METIGLRKLRHQLTPTLDRVEAGTTLVVTDHKLKRAVLMSLDKYQAIQQILRSVGIDPVTLLPKAAVEIQGG